MAVITERQKGLVIEASKLMQKKSDELGVTYFKKIFEIDPSIKNRFSFLPKDSYQRDDMKSHHGKVMKTAMFSLDSYQEDDMKSHHGKVMKNAMFSLDSYQEDDMKSHHSVRDVAAPSAEVFKVGSMSSSAGYEAPIVNDKKLKKHAAIVFKMVCDSVAQICDNGTLEINKSVADHMTSVHINNGVKETDFPVYAAALDETAREALREIYTDDMGEALKIAHKELIKEMQSLEDHHKLIARMEKINHELEYAAYSKERESVE